MKTRNVALALLIFGSFFNFDTLRGQQASSHPVEGVIKNWQSVTPEFLRSPENADLLQMLRIRAKNHNEKEARVLLLNAGDEGTRSLCMAEFHANDSYARVKAANTFELCNDPSLISLFVEDLNRDESVTSEKIWTGDEVARITPTSVLATRAILGIIAHSAQFNQSVKSWASGLQKHSERVEDRDAARSSVRTWWTQNESFIRAKQYSQVRPLTN